MKQYPSVMHWERGGVTLGHTYGVTLGHTYGFDKLDGSNMRAEWTRKKGFHKFGARTRLVGADEKPLGECIELIKNKYEKLNKFFSDSKYEKVVSFFEFYGPNSFAGNHTDEPHTVTLLDINPHKRGFLIPSEFIKLGEQVEIPSLVWSGKFNKQLAKQIMTGELPGVTSEGVVFKTIWRNQFYMFKVKTQAWKDKLRTFVGNDEEKYKALL